MVVTELTKAARAVLTLLIVFGFLATAGPPAKAVSAPHVSIARLKDLPKPLPFPYHEDIDADQQVRAAKAEAMAGGKLLLIDLGGNWCADCRILSAVIALPEVKAFVDAHYVIAEVDVGRINRNLQIPEHYGIKKKQLRAVPVLLVVDPATDRVVNRTAVDDLVDARLSTPQALADWLARWVR